MNVHPQLVADLLDAHGESRRSFKLEGFWRLKQVALTHPMFARVATLVSNMVRIDLSKSQTAQG